MALLQQDNKRGYEFIKGLFGLLGVPFIIGLILFTLGYFSLVALIIPSIKNTFYIIFQTSLVSFRSCLILSIEGTLSGLLFGLLLNTLHNFIYYKNETRYFFKVEKRRLVVVLFMSSLIGFIISFINGASGLYGIFEIITVKDIFINENTPVGQILSDWDVYNGSRTGNNLPWLSVTILIILISFMDIIISITIGVIIGIILGIIEIRTVMNIIEMLLVSNDDQNKLSRKSILFHSIFISVIRSIFVGGLIGLINGITGSILFLMM